MKFAKKPYSPYVKAGRMQRQVHRMIAKLISLTPTILTAALAVIFVVAGIINIIGRGTVKTDFARWGFPDGFNIVCGGLEACRRLLLPSTRFWGLALLGMIMTGAILSLLRHREPISHLAPALGIAALLALDAIVLSAGSFLAPLP
jgi:hypothetical protein